MNNNDKKTNVKKNDNKNSNKLQAAIMRSVWKDLPARAWFELKLEEYATPMAPFRELVVVGGELVARVREDASIGEARSSAELSTVCELGGRALLDNRQTELKKAEMKPQRLVLVRHSAGVIDVLDAQSRSPTVAVAEAATKLKTGLFGQSFRPGATSARALFQRIGEVEVAFTRDASLRPTLERFVPAIMIDEMLAARQQLGVSLMRRGEEQVERTVDLRIISTAIRQRMSEYVVNVLATVNVSQPETVARAEGLLEPLMELRTEMAERRVRMKKLKKAKGKPEATQAEEEVADPALADEPETE